MPLSPLRAAMIAVSFSRSGGVCHAGAAVSMCRTGGENVLADGVIGRRRLIC